MPLPNPNKNESKEQFIKRCMSDPKAREEYPKQDQRFAVCNSKYGK